MRCPFPPGAALLPLVVCFTAAWSPVAGQGPAEWWDDIDAAPPGMHVVEADSVYRVSGFTYDDIYREMQRNGPGADDIGTRLGLHMSQWRYSFELVERPGAGCRLIDPKVLLHSTIILPNWTNVSTAPPAITSGWRPFIAALRRHEEGHRSLAKSQAERLWQSLLGLEARDCEALRERVVTVAGRVLDEGETAQAAYDRETGHGLTQGASWPPRRAGGAAGRREGAEHRAGDRTAPP
jgi:predicted secreted Zn-dependent protease